MVGRTLRGWRLYGLDEGDLEQLFLHCPGLLRVRMQPDTPT